MISKTNILSNIDVTTTSKTSNKIVRQSTATMIRQLMGTNKPLDTMTEDEVDRWLVGNAQRGDKRAEHIIFEKYKNLINRYINKNSLESNRKAIMDKIWIAVALAIKTFNLKGPVPFSAYVYSCIDRRRIDAQRVMCRHWQHEVLAFDDETKRDWMEGYLQIGAIQDGHQDEGKPQAKAMKNATKKQVHDYVNKLGKKERRLIEDLYFKGLSVDTVARRQGISRQAVNQRKQRGLHKLRKMMVEDKDAEL